MYGGISYGQSAYGSNITYGTFYEVSFSDTVAPNDILSRATTKSFIDLVTHVDTFIPFMRLYLTSFADYLYPTDLIFSFKNGVLVDIWSKISKSAGVAWSKVSKSVNTFWDKVDKPSV